MIKQLITAIAAACFLSAGGSGAMHMPKDDSQRDYSNVTSREIAEQLVAEGKLHKILLFPAEFGGETGRRISPMSRPEFPRSRTSSPARSSDSSRTV